MAAICLGFNVLSDTIIFTHVTKLCVSKHTACMNIEKADVSSFISSTHPTPRLSINNHVIAGDIPLHHFKCQLLKKTCWKLKKRPAIDYIRRIRHPSKDLIYD